MWRYFAFLAFFAAPAFAQTPNALVQFADPPELNGAPATTYNRHILWNSGKTCVQRPVGTTWECFATGAEVAATYATQAAVASADSALSGRVSTLETQLPTTDATANAAAATANAASVAIAALQKRACTTFNVAAAITLPLGGLSSTTTVTVTGAPVSTFCGVGTPSFLPLGAEPIAAVTTTGSVSVRFQGSVGLIVPAGNYRVCCDL